ncbi:MAG: site-specific integrase [Nitriliruptorales bacterium]|nr:site-specific integrase [Nitriliruptorales bacterium]
MHLDRRTCRVLRSHRERQDRYRDDAGAAWEATRVVFADALGRPYRPDRVTKAFGRAVRSADVPRIRPHDMRHTHASLLLQAGVNPKVVSERLGHSSVAFTLDTYAHVMPGMQPEAAERLAELILRTTRTRRTSESPMGVGRQLRLVLLRRGEPPSSTRRCPGPGLQRDARHRNS